MPSFSLMTYNIRKGKGALGRGNGRVDDLSQALLPHRPDILLCQEVFHGQGHQLQQSQIIAQSLHLPSYYLPNKKQRRGHYGNATFTHYGVTELTNHNISTNMLEQRGALYTRLTVFGRVLHVFNVHLGLNQSQRLRQVRHVAQLAQAVCGAHQAVLIAGDFNDWTGRINKELTQRLGFVNAFAHLTGRDALTYHARRPVFNLDRVYLQHLHVCRGERFSGAPWTSLSDHLPLWTQLAFDAV